jgi:hypothetical protein
MIFGIIVRTKTDRLDFFMTWNWNTIVQTGEVTTGIDLTNCISYFDGCNTCDIEDINEFWSCPVQALCYIQWEPKCNEYTTGSETTWEVTAENIVSPWELSGPLANMTPWKNILKNLWKTVQAWLYTITIVEWATKDQLKITNNDNGWQVKYVDLPYDKSCQNWDTWPCGKFYNFEYTDDTYAMFSYVTYNENTILAALDLWSLIISEVFQISDETICDTLHNGQQFFRGNSQSFDPVFRITYKNDIGRSKDIGTFKVFWYYADDVYLYLHTDDGEYESNKRFLRKIDLNTLEEVETTSL